MAWSRSRAQCRARCGASARPADDSSPGQRCGGQGCGRNQPQVRAELSADTVLIGSRFKLRVEVTKDVMQMVAFPEFENGRLTDSLEILLEGPVDTVSREGRTEVLAREYLLTCFSPADYRLGASRRSMPTKTSSIRSGRPIRCG